MTDVRVARREANSDTGGGAAHRFANGLGIGGSDKSGIREKEELKIEIWRSEQLNLLLGADVVGVDGSAGRRRSK